MEVRTGTPQKMNIIDFLQHITSAMRREIKGIEIDERISSEVVLRVNIQNGNVRWHNLKIENLSVAE